MEIVQERHSLLSVIAELIRALSAMYALEALGHHDEVLKKLRKAKLGLA